MNDVLRWYNNIKRSSASTAHLYLRRLKKFCSDAGVSPEKLLELDDVERRNLILDYLSDKEGSYAASYYYALKSWLEFFGVEVKVKLKGLNRRRKSEEKVPTPDELSEILTVADLRAKVAISLIAFSGVRLQVLGNYDGTGGLTLGDIPELRLGVAMDDGIYVKAERYEDKNVNMIGRCRHGNGVETRVGHKTGLGRASIELVDMPATIVVRENLSKAGHRYFTFLYSESCKYLLSWLRIRMAKGELLTLDSPLIPSRGGGFLKTKSISELIRKTIRAAGYNFRPYTLRHYFDTCMLMAEAAGIIPRDYRVFWMGHKGDIELQYTLNNHRLPKKLVEDMKIRYEKAASVFLDITRKKQTEPRQKVVNLEELEKYLKDGWEFVTSLPNGKVIVKCQ